MKLTKIEQRYAKYPELLATIRSHTTAKLDMAYAPSALNLARLRRANTLERKTRAKYAAAIRDDTVRAIRDRAHAKRYAYQLASRGRTTTAAPAMHQTRNERRRAARQAADAKREANYLQNW